MAVLASEICDFGSLPWRHTVHDDREIVLKESESREPPPQVCDCGEPSALQLSLGLEYRGCLSASVALFCAGGSGGGRGCWLGGSMPALKAGPPCGWFVLYWELRCGLRGGVCVCWPWPFGARGVGGDADHHGGGCINHGGGSACAGRFEEDYSRRFRRFLSTK